MPPAPRSLATAAHLPALDGARGVAVLFVLLDHASDCGFLGRALSFNRAGGYGVLLFFSLSSFLLAYLFFAQGEHRLVEPRVWLNYWLRRVLRILPLYALALLAWAFLHRDFTLADVGGHLLLRDGQRHFWTIAVEFKFYFLLPLLVLITGVLWRKNRVHAVLAALALAAFLRFGLRPIEKAWSLTNDVWLSQYLKVFFAGSLAGMLFAKLRRYEVQLPRPARIVLEICAWACLAAALLWLPSIYNAVLNRGADVKRLPNSIDFFALAWPLFLLATLLGTGGLRTVLSLPPLRFLGLISYSLYLWHPLLIPALQRASLPPGLSFIAFTSFACTVGAVSYWLIERPLSKVRIG